MYKLTTHNTELIRCNLNVSSSLNPISGGGVSLCVTLELPSGQHGTTSSARQAVSD